MESLTKSAGVLFLAILCTSCSPKKPSGMAEVDSLRAQTEELIRAQTRMGYNNWVHGAPSDQDSLYQQYEHLFNKENIQLVWRVEKEESDPVQKKRLRYFRRYLTLEFLNKHNARLSDEINNLEASSSIVFEGRTVPYREINGLMANEKVQTRRAALYAATDPILEFLNPLHEQVHANNARLAIHLGYSSYHQMMEELKGYSITGFAHVAESILRQTDSLYRGLLKEMVATHLKLTPARFFRFDTGPLFRNDRFDGFFKAESMMRHARSTYRALGVELDSLTNLKIDMEPRPLKNPRAVCFPINVPNDIRLSIKPIGGFDDYSALFHELGHGVHYALTTEHAFEFKYLGEPTVTETFAFLSEYILNNYAWLRSQLAMPVIPQKEFVRFQAFYRLYYVRRYCAKLLYELDLYTGQDDRRGRYAELMRRAIGYSESPSDEVRYLTDVDQHYYSAGYLRAWFLEGQLNEYLKNTYGFNWFENPEAGDFLRNLWKAGDRLDGEGVASLIGAVVISPDDLLRNISMMVLFSNQR